MTQREFAACYYGYMRRVETKQRIVFEAHRFNARAVIQSWAKRGKKIKLTDIAKFPWDDDKTERTKDGYVSYDAMSTLLSLVSKDEQQATS